MYYKNQPHGLKHKTLSRVCTQTIAGLALAVMVAAPSAHALSAQDIETLISLGIIPAEKASVARSAFTTNTASAVACGPFARDLTLGATGSDVSALQTFLINKNALTLPVNVAKGTFGPLTQQALARYQASNGIAPATGYFGPKTRAVVAAACATTAPAPQTPATSTKPTLSGNEASLTDYDSLSRYSNETLEEGEDAKVFASEFSVEDGDVRLERVDVRVESVQQTNESEPWKQIESIALYVNGKKVADKNVDNKKDWSRQQSTETPANSRAYETRFTGLDVVLKEGEDANIELEVTTSDSIDDSDLEQSWKIWIPTDGIRATDGKGIQQYTGSNTESKVFSIDVADSGDVRIKESDDDLDSAILIVDTDKKSSDHEVFRFEIDSRDASVFLNTLTLVASTSDNAIENVLSDVYVEIDGDTYQYDTASTTGSLGEYTFDFEDNNDEVAVEKDEPVEVVVYAQFNKSAGNYNDSTQVQFGIGHINGSAYGDIAITAEGQNTGDDATVQGRQESSVHTLRTTGVALTGNSTSATVREAQFAGDIEKGIYDIEVTVTALEEDAYIPDSVGTSSTDGFVFNITDTGTPFEGSVNAYIASETAKTISAGRHKIPEGTSARFTIRVEIDPENAAAGKSFGVELNTIRFSETNNGTLVDYTVPNEGAFETKKVTID